MPCSNCGGVLPAGANNCPACGVAVKPQTVAQMQAAAQYAQPPAPYGQPPGQYAQPPAPYGQPPGQAVAPYGQTPDAPQPTSWKWGYSRWIGITYGPIPVGVIVVIVGYFIYYSTRR